MARVCSNQLQQEVEREAGIELSVFRKEGFARARRAIRCSSTTSSRPHDATAATNPEYQALPES